MTRPTLGAIGLLAGLAATAAADPEAKPKLALERQPPSLRMRPKHVAAASSPIKTPKPLITPPPDDAAAEPAKARSPTQRISAQVNFGYVVDGAPPAPAQPPAPGFGTVTSDQRRDATFALTRAYGFGEGYLSTHGAGWDNLSTYFAGQFQLVAQTQTYAPLQAGAQKNGLLDIPSPIATWFDRSGFEPRAAYAEIQNFLPQPYLEPLRVRAGELYIYGPWVLHVYGATVAWDGKAVHADVSAGSLVPDYTIDPQVPVTRAAVATGRVRVDLDPLVRVPLALEVEALAMSQGTNAESTDHIQIAATCHPVKNVTISGTARTLSDHWVNQHLEVRARIRERTNLVVDVTHSSADDWLWDPSVVDPDPIAARRYLDLGPVLPQLLVAAHAGTLIAENIDLYVRGAISRELDSTSQQTAYSPSYIEGGGALEVRLRRQVAIGVTTLTRETDVDDPISAEIITQPGTGPAAIPESASSQLGERGFTEVGATARLTLGAQKLSLLVELYGRRTRYALDYCDAAAATCPSGDTGVDDVAFRGGGRVQIDAWIGRHLRLFASYEISSSLELAPEITGYQSLRLMVEGRY